MINSNERIRIFRYLLQDRVFAEVGIFFFEIFDFHCRIELYHQFLAGKEKKGQMGSPRPFHCGYRCRSKPCCIRTIRLRR